MSDLTKIKISHIFFNTSFWIAVVNAYYINYRGLTNIEFFYLMSIYSFLNVAFEYPTGVIGDHFSHKLSVSLGLLVLGFSALLSALPGGFLYYVLVLSLGALGMTLFSGSDDALLYSLSDNFKKDRAQVTFYGILWAVITITLGPILGSIDMRIPIAISSIPFFLTFPVVMSIKNDSHRRSSANVFSKAKEGIIFMRNSKILKRLLTVSFFVGGVFITLKFIYNPLLEANNIQLKDWGWFISFFMLLYAFGSKYASKVSENTMAVVIAFIALLLAFSGFTNIAVISLGAYALMHFLRGIYGVQISVLIANNTNDNIRASVMSAGKLFVRLGAALFSIIYGYILEIYSFPMLALLTAVLVVLAIPFAVIRNP